jgi:heme A synthase
MRGHDLFRYSALGACLLCYITILLGGNVIASGSGLACPNWPTCEPGWNLLPTFAGGVAIEWSHRVAAFFLSISITVLALLGVAYERGRPVLLRGSLIALGLVLSLALLGGLVVESGLVVWLVLAHFGLATILFGLLLILALLANLREIPRRWTDWAYRAAEAHEPASPLEAPYAERAPEPTGQPAPGPARASRGS